MTKGRVARPGSGRPERAKGSFVARRGYEYDHEYGIRLYGKAKSAKSGSTKSKARS